MWMTLWLNSRSVPQVYIIGSEHEHQSIKNIIQLIDAGYASDANRQ